MNNQQRIDFRKKVINNICEVSFKPLLEDDNEIGEMYDAGEITHEDFYEVVEEIKTLLLNREDFTNDASLSIDIES